MLAKVAILVGKISSRIALNRPVAISATRRV
jgi:hypothetical protein